MRFAVRFEKVAVIDLADEALNQATAPMQTYVKGSVLNDSKTTGQPKMKSGRTPDVQNEDKEFDKKKKVNWQNARVP